MDPRLPLRCMFRALPTPPSVAWKPPSWSDPRPQLWEPSARGSHDLLDQKPSSLLKHLSQGIGFSEGRVKTPYTIRISLVPRKMLSVFVLVSFFSCCLAVSLVTLPYFLWELVLERNRSHNEKDLETQVNKIF